MSDLIRRSALSDLGGYLTGMTSTWPRRNYHYEELQKGINKAVTDHSTLVGQDAISAMNRRQALMSLGLVPVHLVSSYAGKPKKAADTDTLLTHCAAGIAACWYLRRGKDLQFVNDLISSYISILRPLVYSNSEAYRRASATLLAQNFRLKGSIVNAQISWDQEIPFGHEAIHYGQIAENSIEQASANRRMAFAHWHRGAQGYEQALSYAETAYGLMHKSTPRPIRSYMASALSLFQAANGKMEDAQISLKEARDCFDVVAPLPFTLYTESNILAISAHVHRYRGHWQEAVDLWGKSLVTPDISALGSILARIEHTEAEVSRDDRPRNMDLCIKLLTEAITGAKELDSKCYQHEAREVYNLLRIAWPREDAIKKLGEDHFGAKK